MSNKSTVHKILLVDDDEALRTTLQEQIFLHEGMEPTVAATGREGLEAAKKEHFSAIILDIGLPDMDGRAICRLMRKEGNKCPIIMLTAADSDADQILGLDSGASDYIMKPFRLSVLLARLRAQMRAHEQSDDVVFNIGPYRFKPSAKVLIDGETGHKTLLTEKETSILKYLYRNGNKSVDRETMLNDVWGYNEGVKTHTLETHIYRLRQKIEPKPGSTTLLLTEQGGYKLNF